MGVYFLLEDYTKQIQSLQETFKVISFKLFSLEMKIRIIFSILREYYFQAVSNSSSANEGDLVAID